MVNKITSPITPLGEIDKINEIIDSIGSSLEGVQISGTDLTVTNKKVNIPLSGTNTFGVAKANAAYGVYNNNGTLTISKATDAQVTGKTSQYRPLTPYNIDLAVKTGITTNTLTLTDTEKTAAKDWLGISEGGGGGATRNIGEIVASTIPLTDAGLHLLDGALIQGSGVYSAFVTYIAGLRTQYSSLFTTESDWQSTVTQYGVCGKFVYNSTNNTVRLPKITGIIEGTTDLTALGDLVEAGLPNITGHFSRVSDLGEDVGGAFSVGTRWKDAANGTGDDQEQILFDASRSSSIYGNSNTVQPQTIKVLYYIVIATSTKTDIQVDIDEVVTDLNGKADTDLLNVPESRGVLVEKSSKDILPRWYRVYADGWCEQGGINTTNSTSERTQSLLMSYKDTNYSIQVSYNGDGNLSNGAIDAYGKAVGSFKLKSWSSDSLCWTAKGYIR